MKLKNYLTRYLILVLPLLLINLNAQDQVDPLEAARLANSAAEKAQAEADAATEAAISAAAEKAASQARSNAKQAKEDEKARKIAEAQAVEDAELDAIAKTASDEAKRKISQELGLDNGPSEEEATAEETDSTEVASEEVEIADEVEELAVKEELGFNVGLAVSVGLLAGETFTNIPTGATIVVTTPYGFDLGPLRYTFSFGLGSYSGEQVVGSVSNVFNPTFVGLGGNLTLAEFIFVEGHIGQVGEGPGFRGFGGLSLERLMKNGLNLPMNILVGSEIFYGTDAAGPENSTGWGGLGVRLDYNF